VDFDGVLSDYTGWVSPFYTDPPLAGAREFIARCLSENFFIVIHTARDPDVVYKWLRRWDFPGKYPDLQHPMLLEDEEEGYDLIVSQRKRPCLVYIDDRGFRFTGDWEAAWQAIRQKAWWEHG
jgi:hypothetical protein